MKVTLIGAGNVATHLGQALKKAGHEIVEVWSRTALSAEELATRIGATAKAYGQLPTGENAEHPSAAHNRPTLAAADVYLLSVKDDALALVAQHFIPQAPHAIWAHTAGTMPLSVLHGMGATRIGVSYPMQTFSKAKEVDFSKIPLFIEGQNCKEELWQLAQSITPKVYELDSEGRKHLHLAAVFACNFVNHCYAMSAQTLEQVGIPFEVMLPLIEETADKVHQLTPLEAQTGPAIRGDKNVMARQEALIHDDTMRSIYQLMSQHIQQLK